MIDFVVCLLVLVSETHRTKSRPLKDPKTWVHLGVFALVGSGLITLSQVSIETYRNRLFIVNAGWWCEIDQAGRSSLPDRLSCFEVRYNLFGAQIELAGTAWDHGHKVSDWTMIDVLQANSAVSRAVYSYRGQSYENGTEVVDTSHGVTELNSASRTGWYLRRSTVALRSDWKNWAS